MRLLKPPVSRTAELTPSAPTTRSALSVSWSPEEHLIVTVPVGSAPTTVQPNRVRTPCRPATASNKIVCRSVRRTARAWSRPSPRSGTVAVRSVRLLTFRVSIRSIRVPAACTIPSSPERSRTTMPLACNARAAPTSAGRSRRSTRVTRMATWLSTKQAASPLIPAPATTTWSTDQP